MVNNKKRKTNTKVKKEEVLNTYMAIGVMIGTVIGTLLSVSNDNFMFLGAGSGFGLLIGILLGTISTEGLVIQVGIGTAKKKKK